MSTVAYFLLLAVAILLAIPVIVLAVEVLAAIVGRDRSRSRTADLVRPRLAVLVPAHNESPGFIPTIEDIRRQLGSRDRLIVVADNCTDDTASVARASGAEVTERHDDARRGKGYALDWGVRFLTSDPPEIVIVIDADCRVGDGTLDMLAKACAATGRPIQARYLMLPGDESSIDKRIASFAWLLKNVIRPSGLSVLGLPCQLAGTGMAFPWRAISAAKLADAQIVEDLKLGLDLAAAGSPPLFLPEAIVSSEFAGSERGAESQQRRWEHGHLQMIGRAPGLFAQGFRERNGGLVALTLDLVVPPVILLGLLLGCVTLAAAGVYWLTSALAPLALSLTTALFYAASIFLAWVVFGREILPVNSLSQVGPFLAAKLRLYRGLSRSGFDNRWVRTDRGGSGEPRE